MTDPTTPLWVRKRDGNRVPFDADKISQALFAATETLGRPDAFLARELTDGALHFLAVEKDDDTLTTAQIAEIVGKTVRELGQPALAEAFTTFAQQREPRGNTPEEAVVVLRTPRDWPPPQVLPYLMEQFTRQAVYSRQIVAAQDEGLLGISGGSTPGKLESCIVAPFNFDTEHNVITLLEELSSYVGEDAVLDAPEQVLVRHERTSAADIECFVHDVVLATRLLSQRTVINLNCKEPPLWAGELASGPLFSGQRTTAHPDMLAEIADRLLERLLPSRDERMIFLLGVRVHWHLSARDFASEPANAERLRRIARLAVGFPMVSFVFDRPRRPVWLNVGIDRQHPALLLRISLKLPRLLAQLDVKDDIALFLHKLGSLTRLALSAAVQKREYLRRLERLHPSALTTGFLLDRARVVVWPVDLDAVVHHFLGRGLSSGGAALDLGKQIVTRLRDVLKQDGRAAQLDAVLDGSEKVGLSGLPLKNQLRTANVLHDVAERGTATLVLAAEEWTADGIADCLRQAWETSDVAAVRFPFRAEGSLRET